MARLAGGRPVSAADRAAGYVYLIGRLPEPLRSVVPDAAARDTFRDHLDRPHRDIGAALGVPPDLLGG